MTAIAAIAFWAAAGLAGLFTLDTVSMLVGTWVLAARRDLPSINVWKLMGSVTLAVLLDLAVAVAARFVA